MMYFDVTVAEVYIIYRCVIIGGVRIFAGIKSGWKVRMWPGLKLTRRWVHVYARTLNEFSEFKRINAE